VGFVVDKVALGQVFCEYFAVPCELLLHQLLHTHRLSCGAGRIGQLVAGVASGLSLTPPQETKKKLTVRLIVAVLLRVRKVPGSNLGPKVCYT
jgi:hypothetical protein